MSNNNPMSGVTGSSKAKKKNQKKYPKPTQPIYRPPSARIELASSSGPLLSSMSSSSIAFNDHNHHPSDVFLIKPQPSTSTTLENVISNVFPIRGVLKRSKSFGINNNNKNYCDKFSKYYYLDDTSAGTFFLTLENVNKENVQLIKQSLNSSTCSTITMTQLLQIIRILCNKVLERPNNACIVAKVCLEIHHNQQLNMTQLNDHKFLFLESLASCLREWFNERDKLRFTTGGARRWTAYILFMMEIYINLKETIVKDLEMNRYYLSDSNDDDEIEEESSEEDLDVIELNGNNSNNMPNNEFSANDSSQADSSSCKSGSSERSIKKTSSTNSIETKIINLLLAKQQKQFAHLLLDSFHVILSNPNSTPAEIECMQTVFRKCGKYLDEDNPSRIKAIIFIIRDILLNYSNANQFINAANNNGNGSSISKNLLEIIELASSQWKFSQAQQIYYFPYTKID